MNTEYSMQCTVWVPTSVQYIFAYTYAQQHASTTSSPETFLHSRVSESPIVPLSQLTTQRPLISSRYVPKVHVANVKMNARAIITYIHQQSNEAALLHYVVTLIEP